MYQGVFAIGAKLFRYNHLDYDHLEDILRKNCRKETVIASETVFGMDGDIANIDILSGLSNKYGAILYLDEAHATGLYGPDGYGTSTNHSPDMEKTIVMGTFSKALGCSGAYVACSLLMRNYFIQKCKSFIYSTEPSPFCVGAAMHSWKLVKTLNETRQRILKISKELQDKLGLKSNNTNITPILFNDIKSMRQSQKKCLENNIIVSGITRPTSPTPRIRIVVNAKHTENDVEKLLMALSKI